MMHGCPFGLWSAVVASGDIAPGASASQDGDTRAQHQFACFDSRRMLGVVSCEYERLCPFSRPLRETTKTTKARVADLIHAARTALDARQFTPCVE